MKGNTNRTIKGWRVVAAGTGMNLAFGVLYAWSIFAGKLQETLGWTKTESSIPYTIAIIMFATMMVPAGRLQDKIGPRWVATLGGVLIGSGCILAGAMNNLLGLSIAFGVLAGSGIGLGYAATTPPAVKWFSAKHKGLISGIVVGGFGLAPLYIVPLTKFLLSRYDVFTSFRLLGVLFLLITLPLAQFIRNPKDHELPEAPVPVSQGKASAQAKAKADTAASPSMDLAPQLTYKDMFKTKEFYMLWFMFFAGATGGLMTIGSLKTLVTALLGDGVGFQLVAFAAIANALGRPIAGVISGKIGRGKAMAILYVLQAIALFTFNSFTTLLPIFAAACMIYFSYGAMAAVYPSACADNYGTKNLGLNYGILFSAWGVGGIFGPILSGRIADLTGSFHLAFVVSGVILLVAAGVGFIYKPYQHKSLNQ